jgi:hypothetical protein
LVGQFVLRFSGVALLHVRLEAVRMTLREAAARRRVRSAIRDEASRVAADEHDREEMRLIREQLADLAPPVPDSMVAGRYFACPRPEACAGTSNAALATQ